MTFQPKNILIAGGTGFLGYHSALFFREIGCSVTSIALSGEVNTNGWYPKDIKILFANLFDLSEDEIFKLVSNQNSDTFVYALGPDDRITPKAPSYEFFHSRLVVQSSKICTAIKKAGIRRCIVLNSYFSYFDRLEHGALSKRHPYIRCRNEQADALIGLGESGKFDVMVLELPYIFGSMPERLPIWKTVFLDRFIHLPLAAFPNGGTAAIHVTGVARAVAAVAINGTHGGKYPIASSNINYHDMLDYMLRSAGFPKPVVALPTLFFPFVGFFMRLGEKFHGRQSGLNMKHVFRQILSKSFFLDPEETPKQLNYKELGFTHDDKVWEGIAEAMKACYPATYTPCSFPETKTTGQGSSDHRKQKSKI